MPDRPKEIIHTNDPFKTDEYTKFKADDKRINRNLVKSEISSKDLNINEIMEIALKFSPTVPFSLEDYEKYDHLSWSLNAHKHWGAYALITTELVDFCRHLIGDKVAVEICAGHGALGRSLGIPITDRKLMESTDVRVYSAYKDALKIDYPKDVETLTANQAIKKYAPEVVIACWGTQKSVNKKDMGQSNMYGIDEMKITDTVPYYLHIGNTGTHKSKRVRARRHYRITAPWLVSRSTGGENELLIFTEAKIDFDEFPEHLDFFIEE